LRWKWEFKIIPKRYSEEGKKKSRKNVKGRSIGV